MSLSPVSGNSNPVDSYRDYALDPALATSSTTLARTVDLGAGYPRGDGTFADSVRGTGPQPGRDLEFALMANDSYTLSGPDGATGTAAEADLQAAGWNRLQPSADGTHLVDGQGNQIPISPDALHDPQTGFDAAIYQNAEGQYVVAYRGTDNWGLGAGGDSRANGGQGLGMETAQYSQAMELANLAADTFGEGNVAITGHSLGGGLASAAMLATDIPGVTFNASGLSNNTLASLGFNPNAARGEIADSGQIRRYVVDGDPLTLAQQDIPIIGLPLSPPNAVGTELRVAPPEGMGRLDMLGLHGGGGDNPSYVESLRQHQAVAPADRSGTNAGLLLGTIENIGEHNLNQIGALANGLGGLYNDGASTLGEAYTGISTAVSEDYGNGRYLGGTFSIAGDVVDGAAGLAGDVVSNTLGTAGDAVENVANLGGSVLRDLGDRTGWDAPFDAVASGVEWTGRAVDTVADGAGQGVQWGLDKIGDGAEFVMDKVGDGTQWVADRVVDGVSWAGGKVADGASWVGDRVSDGARWAGENLNPLNWFR